MLEKYIKLKNNNGDRMTEKLINTFLDVVIKNLIELVKLHSIRYENLFDDIDKNLKTEIKNDLLESKSANKNIFDDYVDQLEWDMPLFSKYSSFINPFESYILMNPALSI